MQASFQKSMHSSKMVYDKSAEYNSILCQSLQKDSLNFQIVLSDFSDTYLKSHLLLSLSQFAYEHQLQRYKKEGKDFVSSYINILAAGGSKKPEKLLSEYGFDIRSPKFWQEGFDYVDEQVKALSSLN